jgi:hypothetical protein
MLVFSPIIKEKYVEKVELNQRSALNQRMRLKPALAI